MAASTVVIVILVFPGLRPVSLPSAPSGSSGPSAPRPWLVAVLAFAAGTGLELGEDLEKFRTPWELTTGGILAIDVLAVGMVLRGSGRQNWGAAHRFALAAGALLVYCWCGYRVELNLHGPAPWASTRPSSAWVDVSTDESAKEARPKVRTNPFGPRQAIRAAPAAGPSDKLQSVTYCMSEG